MKKLRKVLALVLAMVMVLAMGITASAATITINPNTPSDATSAPTYTYYVMMKASVGTEGKAAYYVESEDLAKKLDELAIDDNDLFTVTKVVGSNRWNVVINNKADGSSYTNEDGPDIAAALQTIKNLAITNGTATNNKIELDYDGYVLIESSLGTTLILDTVTSKEITEKNEYPSIPGGKQDNINDDTVSIGQTITYTIPVKIPENVAEKDIIVKDTITDGLTMNTDITVTNATDLTKLTWVQEGSVEAVPDNPDTEEVETVKAATKYTVTIPAGIVKKNAGKIINLTYTAQVNSNAVVLDAESNKAHLEYDNFSSVETETEVTIQAFTLRKINGADAVNKTDAEKLSLPKLDGAKFSLWTASEDGKQIYVKKDGDVYRADVSVTVNDEKQPDPIEAGEATIEGLAAGTYYLQEDVAPTGYNKLTSRQPILVSVTTSSAGVDIAVENNAGSTLPSTGGMGTTLFYVFGAVLVIGAGIVLVTRRRMAK